MTFMAQVSGQKAPRAAAAEVLRLAESDLTGALVQVKRKNRATTAFTGVVTVTGEIEGR